MELSCALTAGLEMPQNPQIPRLTVMIVGELV
jgi:hypothetical protein